MNPNPMNPNPQVPVPAQDDPRAGRPSASKFELIAECEGELQLEHTLTEAEKQRLPVDEESAAFGTAVHLARQTGNILPLSKEQEEVYAEGMRVEGEIVRMWCETNQIQAFHEGPREVRLWYHDSDLNPVASAQLDVHFISDQPAGHLLVIDWKALTCPHLTPAQRNWQGRVQVLCAQEEYGLNDIAWALCKPKVTWNQKDMVQYNAQSLQYAKFSVDYVLWASRQPNARRRPGAHCRHCPCNAGACPEAAALSLLPSVIVQQQADEGLMSKQATKRPSTRPSPS